MTTPVASFFNFALTVHVVLFIRMLYIISFFVLLFLLFTLAIPISKSVKKRIFIFEFRDFKVEKNLKSIFFNREEKRFKDIFAALYVELTMQYLRDCYMSNCA